MDQDVSVSITALGCIISSEHTRIDGMQALYANPATLWQPCSTTHNSPGCKARLAGWLSLAQLMTVWYQDSLVAIGDAQVLRR
jgi:hypothetical protein